MWMDGGRGPSVGECRRCERERVYVFLLFLFSFSSLYFLLPLFTFYLPHVLVSLLIYPMLESISFQFSSSSPSLSRIQGTRVSGNI